MSPHNAEVLAAAGSYSPLAADALALVTGVVSGWAAMLIMWAIWVAPHSDTHVSRPPAGMDVSKDVHDYITSALRSAVLDDRDVRVGAAREALARLDALRVRQQREAGCHTYCPRRG